MSLTLDEATYGLGVMEEDTGFLLHAVVYRNPPTQVDVDHLTRELAEDPDLYDEVKDYDWTIVVLTPEMVETVKRLWGSDSASVISHDGTELDED